MNFNGGTLTAITGGSAATFFPAANLSAYVYSGGAYHQYRRVQPDHRRLAAESGGAGGTGSGLNPGRHAGGRRRRLRLHRRPVRLHHRRRRQRANAVAIMGPDGSPNGTQTVTGILITNPGVGYTSAPTISFIGGTSSIGLAATCSPAALHHPDGKTPPAG